MHCPVHERSIEPASFPDWLGFSALRERRYHC
nr:MAG TPA: hypothetical protein [Caudoviricetes sp.]